MSDEIRVVAQGTEDEQARRARLLRIVLPVGFGGAVLILAILAVASFLTPRLAVGYLVPLIVGFMISTVLSLWLSQRGHLSWATGIYLVSMTTGLFAAIYFLNGTAGPMAVALITVPVLATLLSGRTTAMWFALGISAIYLAMVALEGFGLLQPGEISGVALNLLYAGILVLTLVITALLVIYSARLLERIQIGARERELELAQASLQAQETALAEHEAREWEGRAAGQLRQTVREYSTFLEHISAGDYGARLELPSLDAAGQQADELLTLGRQLNTTVDTLIAALNDLQVVQRRYVRESWEGFAAPGVAHRGFRYEGTVPASGSGAEVVIDEEAWLESMTQAVRERSLTVDGNELAIPIMLRDEVIGSIGVRREDIGGWSEADVAMAEVITNQLVQTIENLRLLDETEQRAAQEHLVSEIATRMRATLNIQTVLETAADELYDVLGLDKVVIRLAVDGEDRDSASQAG